jgi:ABC transporter fused permease/ATP-binding protein
MRLGLPKRANQRGGLRATEVQRLASEGLLMKASHAPVRATLPSIANTTPSAADRKGAWRRIFALSRPEAGNLALGTLFLVISSAGSLAFPQGIRLVIDEALGRASGHAIDIAALVMILVFVVQGAAGAARYYVFTRAGERIVAQLRQDLFRSLTTQEIAFFDSQKTGELTNRLSADTEVLQNAVSVNVSMGLRSLTSMVGGLALLFYTSTRLTLLMLLVVPPVAILAMRYGRKVRGLSRDVQDALARSTGVAEEALSGIRTVRAFSAESREVARFGDAVRESLSLAFRRIRLAAFFFGTMSSAAYVAGAAVFWYGGHLVLDGKLSVGALTSFLVYTMLVAFSLATLSDLWADLNRASGASSRVFELLDRKPAMPLQGGRTLPSISGAVAWNHVQFAYPTRKDVRILDDFSLSLAAGEVVALVGPSGAGKSTVASLLYRLYDPSSGSLSLDGVNIAELDPSWLRTQVGVVSQEPLLFSASVAENIRYGSQSATDAQVAQAARIANAHDFITAFPEGYATRVGERGVQLSGGQKQRVAIARAALKDPRILVLDEATSALDAESEFQVRQALERLMQGRTTLVIAHRLSSVKSAHRVVVLDAGRIVQSGPHETLVAEEGLYRRLVERQFAPLGEIA